LTKLKTDIKIKNIRDLYRCISNFKKDFQARTNIEKDEKGDFLLFSHSILARWRNYSQLLNIHGVNAVMQTEMRTAEPLEPKPSAFEVELVIEKLKSHITRY